MRLTAPFAVPFQRFSGQSKRLAAAGLASLAIVLGGSLATPHQAHANPKYASIVIDHHTGKVLRARNADAKRFPASLTKVMTLYMVFDALEAGDLKLSDRITVSARAAARIPSKIGFKPGARISVENAILALVTKSANDVASAVAEHLGGTESNFGDMMTRKARAIGMKNTVFKNASGLPNSAQVTTARDMATMSRSIMVAHPKYYKYFSRTSFTYRGVRYGNHNRLLRSYTGTDGIKTGYTRASGFNLTTSAKRRNKHLVAVVMGGKSGKSRNAHMVNILNQNFGKAVARRNAPDMPPGVMIARAIITPPLPPVRPTLPHDMTATQVASIRDGARSPEEVPQVATLQPVVKKVAARPITASATAVPNLSIGTLNANPTLSGPKPLNQIKVDQQAFADASVPNQSGIAPPLKLVPRGTIEDARTLAAERLRSMQSMATGEQPTAQPVTLASATGLAPIPQPSTTGAAAPQTLGTIPVTQQPSTSAPIQTASLQSTNQVVKPDVLHSPFKDSWVIQIGAVGSENEAWSLLNTAKDKAPEVLNNLHAFTETTSKNNTTFHRARFAGFKDSRSAQNACRTLKRRAFGCFPVRPE